MSQSGSKIYINKTVELTKGEDGFYVDEFGVIYALPDKSLSVDDINRCGIGVLSFPKGAKINGACSAHDYMYSSPVYQAFHTRKEADDMLQQHAKILGYPVVGRALKYLSRLFGGQFWENKKTSN